MKEDQSFSAVTEEVGIVITKDGSSVSGDDALLMSMGKKPELKRVYNFWTRALKPVPQRQYRRLIVFAQYVHIRS
jgi:hypothetical protein